MKTASVNPVITAGASGSDLIYNFTENTFYAVPPPVRADGIRLSRTAIYFQIRVGLGRSIAERWLSGELSEQQAAVVTDWIFDVANRKSWGAKV